MANLERFAEINKSLRGQNASEILKDIEDRMWQINLIDKWKPQDKEDYEIFCELQKIYRDIEERENRENEI